MSFANEQWNISIVKSISSHSLTSWHSSSLSFYSLYQLCRQLETLPKCCSLQTKSLPIWLCTSSPTSRSSSIFNENEETRARFKCKGQYHCKRVGVWASWWENSISFPYIPISLLTALIPRYWASFPVALQCWNRPEWWQRQWWSKEPLQMN